VLHQLQPRPTDVPEPEDETAAGAQLRFNDARRFGFMDLCAADALARHPRLCKLGPEPLEDGFDGASLAARLAGRSAVEAMAAGRRLAEAVIRRQGAIIPRDATPAL